MAAITTGTNAVCSHKFCRQPRLLQYSARALSRSSTTRISIITSHWNKSYHPLRDIAAWPTVPPLAPLLRPVARGARKNSTHRARLTKPRTTKDAPRCILGQKLDRLRGRPTGRPLHVVG